MSAEPAVGVRQRANLKLVKVNTETGEVVEPLYKTNHDEAVAYIEDLSADFEALSRVLAKTQRMMERMVADREKAALEAPQRATVEFLHKFWQQRTGHTGSPLTVDRHDAITYLLRHYEEKRKPGAGLRRIMCAVVCVGALPYSDFGVRVAKPSPGADPKARVKRDSWAFLAESSDRFERLAVTGWRWLQEHGESLPSPPEQAVLTLVQEGQR
jgi:hypothetical protein